MMEMKNIKILVIISLLISGCSNNINNKENITIFQDSKAIYSNAMSDLNSRKYEEAILKFNDIILKYPLSNEGAQSQIMLAFIDYVKLEYSEAIYKYKKIIKVYPSHKNIDYAYYMLAICYFEQIESETFDGFNNQESLINFKEVINRFPNSEYAKDSYQKIIFINENIAAKHMNIAMYYLKQKKYLASLSRYKIVISDHSKSKFVPEALYRLVEIYYKLGMLENVEKTAAVIVYNYPNSKWYKYAYDIVNKDNNKNNRFKIIKKLSDLFGKDVKKN